MIYLALALALALAPAPVPLPAPTLKGLQPVPHKGCSDIAWQWIFRYLAPDYRSGPNVVLLTDYGPGWMVFLTLETRGSKNEQFIREALRNLPLH